MRQTQFIGSENFIFPYITTSSLHPRIIVCYQKNHRSSFFSLIDIYQDVNIILSLKHSWITKPG